MHWLVKSTFSSEIHRPSSAKLWQIPADSALPKPPLLFLRLLPLVAHDTSYLAALAKMPIFLAKSIAIAV